MATTMTLIAKQTVGSGGAASVTFSNIPQTYTDLKIVYSIRSDNTNPSNTIDLSFNGSTTGFTNRYLQAPGPASGSNFARYSGVQNSSSETSNTFSNGEIYIPNYTGSNNKSYSADGVYENNSSSGYGLAMVADLWSNTAAITSIGITGYAGNFVEFSTFYLYGISNSTTTQNTTVPYAYGGDVITTDGTYWYHAFKYSGSFVPQKNLTADILVVAGGGGGSGAGGGAGGLLGFTAQALTSATNYTCSIGSGGAGQNNVGTNGTTGNDSQFASLTLVKGGGGGAKQDGTGAGQNGGSGGGGAYASATGSPTSGQGNAGGGSTTSGQRGNGGGGGAGASGTAGTSTGGGNGGVGVSTYSSWGLATTTGQNVSGTVYYAGGGGGANFSSDSTPDTNGTGGYGGGGDAPSTLKTAGTAGTANTGGGGGGGSDGPNPTVGSLGGNGGSGIIIVRYAV